MTCVSPVPIAQVVCLFGCVLAAPAAFGQKVKVEFDPKADFSKVRQYQWRTHPVFEKRPELREVYATGIQLVLEAGNTQLMKRGFQPVEESPDVYITFFLHADIGSTERVISDPWYGWYDPVVWTTVVVEHHLQGMLVIDIVDARTSKLLWRAFCGDQIKDMSKRDKNITSAVRKALERFPPKTR